MSETETQRKKPKIHSLTAAAVLLTVAICSFLLVFFFGEPHSSPPLPVWAFAILVLTVSLLPVMVPVVFILGIVGLIKAIKVKAGIGKLLLGIFLIAAGAIGTINAAIVHYQDFIPLDDQTKCKNNLLNLKFILINYGFRKDFGQYSFYSQWCDIISDPQSLPAHFQCPANKESKCSYAMNPNCNPNSPKDVVLLFETKGGWNQFGGPELLTTENHEGKGCNILFKNGTVRFIKSEQLAKLKWKDEQKQ